MLGDYIADDDFKIKGKKLNKILPKKPIFELKTHAFFMNNRKKFYEGLAQMFDTYDNEAKKNEPITCDTIKKDSGKFEPLLHQKIVRDYLSNSTPFRGLLLCHMLGSGKTCTSIAIAEANKSEKLVITLQPASLTTNLFAELKKCGDPIYKIRQYWVFVSLDGKDKEYIEKLALAVSIDSQFLQNQKGIWLADLTKTESNFKDLSPEQQSQINSQIEEQIHSKYLDINYNNPHGLSSYALMTENFTRNIFDNATIIIDEAHNLVSTIVGRLNDGSKKEKSFALMIYYDLMRAINCKIVLLSGTPIINYPNEIAILYNILRGNIRQWSIPITIGREAKNGLKLSKETILKIFEKDGFRLHDFVDYESGKLTITRNPYGFVNVAKDTLELNLKKSKSLSASASAKKGGNDKKTKKTHNDSSKKTRKTTAKTTTTTTTNNNFATGGDGNTTEANNNFATGGKTDEYYGVELNEQGNVNDNDFIKMVKLILRNNGLVFNDNLVQSKIFHLLPQEKEEFNMTFIGDNDIKNENVFKKRIMGLTSFYRSEQENLMPKMIESGERFDTYFEIKVPMSETQFEYYSKARHDEREQDKKKRKRAKTNNPFDEGDEKNASSYRSASRSACNFAFPNEVQKPITKKRNKKNYDDDNDDNDDNNNNNIANIKKKKKGGDGDDEDDNGNNDDEENEDNEESDDNEEEDEYGNIDSKEKEELATAKSVLLELKGTNEENSYLTLKKLELYSPKFKKIFEQVDDKSNVGLHLIYSQFVSLEGIGILSIVFELAGYAPFRLIKKNGYYDWDEKEEDKGKPKFFLYTGDTDAEERTVILNIYNGNWHLLPNELSSKLKKVANNNNLGELVKVLMITKSAAEGINLSNVRFVHIVEPYFNLVRLQQVVGRARRICSHSNLPEELRTVQAFVYMSVFSEKQKNDKEHNVELMTNDVSKDSGNPVSTDEHLFELSLRKQKIIDKIMECIKDTSIDCAIHNTTKNCMTFGNFASSSFSSNPDLEKDLRVKDENEMQKTTEKLAFITFRGIEYLMKEESEDMRILYDAKKYKTLNKLEKLILIKKVGFLAFLTG
jgi:hypothetical protein